MGATGRDLLFVYGTLMRGERSAHRLADARFVREARTAPHYWLAHMESGSYPALVEGGADAVFGEVYEVATSVFDELDVFEDVPDLYRRVRIQLGPHRPWVYLFRSDAAVGLPRIPSGDWRRR